MIFHVRFLHLLPVMLAAGMVSSCSSTSEQTPQDDYFTPVDRVVHQRPDSGSSPVDLTRGRTLQNDEQAHREMMELLRTQNGRLLEAASRLKNLTAEDSAAEREHGGVQPAAMRSGDPITAEMVMEAIRERSRHIDEITGQIEALAARQSFDKERMQAGPDRAMKESLKSAPAKRLSTEAAPPDAGMTYAKAIQMYRLRQYHKSIRVFQNLLKANGDSPLRDKSRFWMGVCYFDLKRIPEAMSEFTEILKSPASPKREAAYFMIGQCYEYVGAAKFARSTFEKLRDEFPRGSLRQETEKKIALLK